MTTHVCTNYSILIPQSTFFPFATISTFVYCRLAHSICAQIKDRVCKSHRSFSTALRQLQTHHNGRLEKTEEHQLKLRKIYAPKVARLALESTSFKDYILHGIYF